MIKQFKEHFEEFSIAEIGIFVPSVALALGAVFQDWVPAQFHDLQQDHPYFTGVTVVLCTYSPIRFIASIILFTAPFKKFGWFLTSIFCVVSSGLFLQAEGLASAESSENKLNPPLHIFESNLSLTIDCTGKGVLQRTQKFTPNEDLDSIVEYEFFVSGGLKDSNVVFKIQEQSDGQLVDINCETGPGTENMDRLVNRILGGKKLKKGHRYTRVTTITGPGAYADTIGDAFTTLVATDIDALKCDIRFTGDCEIDVATVKIQMVNERGVTLTRPKTIEPDFIDSKLIRFGLTFPPIGNKYRVSWHYRIPPKP